MQRKALLIAAVAAVMLPVIAIAASTTSRGGSPSDVFASTDGGVCNGEDPVRRGAAALLPTSIEVDQPSHVLASFTATVSTKERHGPELTLGLRISGEGSGENSPDSIQRQGRGHSIVTVTWTFDTVEPGAYTVLARARVPGLRPDQEGTNLQACSLTVFVAPVV